MGARSLRGALEDQQVQPEDGERLPGIPNRPFEPDDTLPAVCTINHVAWVYGVTVSQAHRMRRQRHLDRFLLDPTDKRARFSGLRLKAWANGERIAAVDNQRFFGRKTFGGGR